MPLVSCSWVPPVGAGPRPAVCNLDIRGLVTFDPAAPSVITTTFDSAKNRWETLVNPNNLSDEIFFSARQFR